MTSRTSLFTVLYSICAFEQHRNSACVALLVFGTKGIKMTPGASIPVRLLSKYFMSEKSNLFDYESLPPRRLPKVIDEEPFKRSPKVKNAPEPEEPLFCSRRKQSGATRREQTR